MVASFVASQQSLLSLWRVVQLSAPDKPGRASFSISFSCIHIQQNSLSGSSSPWPLDGHPVLGTRGNPETTLSLFPYNYDQASSALNPPPVRITFMTPLRGCNVIVTGLYKLADLCTACAVPPSIMEDCWEPTVSSVLYEAFLLVALAILFRDIWNSRTSPGDAGLPKAPRKEFNAPLRCPFCGQRPIRVGRGRGRRVAHSVPPHLIEA